MSITIDWETKIVSSTSSITDILAFKQELRVLESSIPGILYEEVLTFSKIDLGGGAFFYAVDLINGYQLKFPIAGNYEIIGNINTLIIPVAGVFVDRKTSSSFATIGSGGSGGGGLTTEQAEQLERIDSRVDIKVSESVGGGGGGIGFGQIQYIIEEVLKEYDKKPKEKIDENEKEYIMELEKKIDGLYTYIDEVKVKIPGRETGTEALLRIKSIEEFLRNKENKTEEEKNMMKGLKKATKEIIELLEQEESDRKNLEDELKNFITSLI